MTTNLVSDTRSDSDRISFAENQTMFEPSGIIAILVGFVQEGQSMSFAVVDGDLKVLDDIAALEDAACAGALVLAATDGGVTVDVIGEPWADLSAALVPHIEQQDIDVAMDASALIKLQDANIGDGDGASYLFIPANSPDFAWATGDWNGDGVADIDATMNNRDQFIFSDGAVRFVSDEVSSDIRSLEGGGIFNDGAGLLFDDLIGMKEVDSPTGTADFYAETTPQNPIIFLVGEDDAFDGLFM